MRLYAGCYVKIVFRYRVELSKVPRAIEYLAVQFVIADSMGFGKIVVSYSIVMALSAIAGIVLMTLKKKKDGTILAEATMKRNLMLRKDYIQLVD